MEPIKYKELRFMDKSELGDGPWQIEPDKVQWIDEDTGFTCLIVRNKYGALCGYVGVGREHPFFEKHYIECDVEVHGGLTFSDFCQDKHMEDRENGICHIGEEKLWWLGFDCAHESDFVPFKWPDFIFSGTLLSLFERCLDDKPIRLDGRSPPSFGGTYRDLAYVKEECKNLCKQLRSMDDHPQAEDG